MGALSSSPDIPRFPGPVSDERVSPLLGLWSFLATTLHVAGTLRKPVLPQPCSPSLWPRHRHTGSQPRHTLGLHSPRGCQPSPARAPSVWGGICPPSFHSKRDKAGRKTQRDNSHTGLKITPPSTAQRCGDQNKPSTLVPEGSF